MPEIIDMPENIFVSKFSFHSIEIYTKSKLTPKVEIFTKRQFFTRNRSSHKVKILISSRKFH